MKWSRGVLLLLPFLLFLLFATTTLSSLHTSEKTEVFQIFDQFKESYFLWRLADLLYRNEKNEKIHSVAYKKDVFERESVFYSQALFEKLLLLANQHFEPYVDQLKSEFFSSEFYDLQFSRFVNRQPLLRGLFRFHPGKFAPKKYSRMLSTRTGVAFFNPDLWTFQQKIINRANGQDYLEFCFKSPSGYPLLYSYLLPLPGHYYLIINTGPGFLAEPFSRYLTSSGLYPERIKRGLVTSHNYWINGSLPYFSLHFDTRFYGLPIPGNERDLAIFYGKKLTRYRLPSSIIEVAPRQRLRFGNYLFDCRKLTGSDGIQLAFFHKKGDSLFVGDFFTPLHKFGKSYGFSTLFRGALASVSFAEPYKKSLVDLGYEMSKMAKFDVYSAMMPSFNKYVWNNKMSPGISGRSIYSLSRRAQFHYELLVQGLKQR